MKEHIIINKDRTVVVPDSVRKIGIQYDHKVNTLTFDCPRYADDNQSIDLSRMAIYINFSRSDKTKGSVAATNIFVDPDDPEIIHFDFVITRSVTLVNGPIICLVCAKSTDAEGVEVNHWNSELFNKLSVGEGLEAEELTEEEIDYITSLLQEINTTRAEVADIDTRVEDLEFNQEKQGVVSEVDLETMTWTEGSYITGSGAIGSSSGYGISELVTIPKMSTLILDATGYQSDVAMIAKSDHTPLVTSVDGKTHYEYYTDEEIQVYISCKTTVAKSAKIVRNVSETLSDLERENSELKSDLSKLSEDVNDLKNNGTGTSSGTSSGGNLAKLAKAIPYGNIIPTDEKEGDYLCWTMGNCKYDKYTDKVVFLYNAREEHVASLSRIYMRTIDCQTYEVSKSTLVADTMVINGTEYALVSNFFLILEDGTYLVLAKMSFENNTNNVVANYVYKSTDHGATWTQTEISIDTGSYTYNGNHNPVVLSNGRIIATITTASLQHVMYSDDKGENWTIARMVSSSGLSEGFIVELDDIGNLCCISRQSASEYTTAKPAKLSFSSDYGTTWTAPVDSVSIPDMTANPCSAIVDKDGIVTLFYGSRYNGDGYNATLYKQSGTLKQLAEDSMDKPVVICHGDAVHGQDFGYVACCEDKYGQMYIVYYDGDNTVQGYTTIKLVRASRSNIANAINDSVAGKTNVYSAEKVRELLAEQYAILIKKINDIVIENDGSVDGGETGSYPITDKLVHWFRTEDVVDTTWTDFIDKVTSYTITSVDTENNLVDLPSFLNLGNNEKIGIGNDFTIEGVFHHSNLLIGHSLYNFVSNNCDYSVRVSIYQVDGTSYQYDTMSNFSQSLVHVVFTVDISNLAAKVYINGKLEGTATITNDTLTTNPWEICENTPTGKLGNWRIYDKVLTADEVSNNYKYEAKTYSFSTVN